MNFRFLRITLTRNTIDLDVLLLPDAVTARLRLQVVLRVPVGVVDDDGVGYRQVDAEPARARAQQEDEACSIKLNITQKNPRVLQTLTLVLDLI